jgi:hypothetical protein
VLLTVATEGVAEVQGLTAAGVPDPINVIVAPSQTVVGPEIVGCGFTVTVAVARQPLLSV